MEGYIPVYYPGTTDAQSAAPINFPAGVVFSGVDLTATAVRTLRVQGQAINGATGQPALNANVMLIPAARSAGGGGFRGGIRNPGNLRSRVNNQGAFNIRGVPGLVRSHCSAERTKQSHDGSLPLEIGNSDVQNVSLVISQVSP